MYRPVNRAVLITALLALAITTSLSALPDWAESYGTDSPYGPPQHLSGFGSAERSESDALELARERARADLAEKIRLRVRSNVVVRDEATERSSDSSVTSRIHTAADVELPRLEYLVDKNLRRMYVLAYTPVEDIKSLYAVKGRRRASELSQALSAAESALRSGDLDRVQRLIDRAQGTIIELRELEETWSALDQLGAGPRAKAQQAFSDAFGGERGGFGEAIGNEEYDALPTRVTELRRSLSEYEPADLPSAARYLARRLSEAGVSSATFAPLIYEQSDFSTAFGRRFAASVEAALSSSSSTVGSGDIVVNGSYWVGDKAVQVTLRARQAQSGETVAVVETSIPADTLDEADLTPPNVEQAMAAGSLLLSEAVVDGGLQVDVWTDRGSSEDAIVYEEGEAVQFYFRVNQPAYLRLTYQLVSGELVLLEESFFIGSDRVNRVVPLPYRFTVVPPFGVERMIVTATSDPPEPPATVPKEIDGQLYQVFSDTQAVVAQTRGLVRESPPKDADDTRVGEATLAITTMAKGQE